MSSGAVREDGDAEKPIAELEARVASDEQLGDPAIYALGADLTTAKKLTDDRTAAESLLAAAYADWEKMGELMAEV